MRKSLLVLVAIFTLVLAVPAMAEVSLTGFLRVKGYSSNYLRYDAGDIVPFKRSSPGASFNEAALTNAAPDQARVLLLNTDAPTAGYFDQRARLRFEAKGENVGAVAFFEVDSRWGDIAYKVGRNQGGGLEADAVNLETKNVYIWFKPNANTTINVGIQNYTDPYHGVLFGAADFAGITATYNMAPIDFRFIFAKLKDDATAADQASGAGSALVSANSLVGKDSNNDTDLWGLETHFSPVKDTKVGLNLHFVNDHAFPATFASNKLYNIGLDGSLKVSDPLTLSAFVFFQGGKAKSPTPGGQDIKLKGWAADVRADVAAGPGKGFIEAIYISGQDPNSTSNDYKGIVTGSNYALAASFFYTTDMEILLPSIDDINTSQALTYDAKNQGLGLIHVGAGYTLPLMDKLTGKVGLGYSRFAKSGNSTQSFINGQALAAVTFANLGVPGDKAQGIEINGKLNYNLAKGLDLTGVAAYAILGKAYDVSSADKAANPGLDNPDNLYKLVARLNYAF